MSNHHPPFSISFHSLPPINPQSAIFLQGLGEHWGGIDEQINTDLEDIAASYSSGHFILGWLDGATFTLNYRDFVIPLNALR